MSTVQLYYGTVLLRNGSVAVDANCCCDVIDCYCFINQAQSARCCDCLDVEFGPDSTKPAAGVLLTGDTLFQGLVPFTCPTGISQLFMANCGDPITTWWYHQPDGTTFVGGVLHYRYLSLRVRISYCALEDGGITDSGVIGVGGQLQFEVRSVYINVTTQQPENEWTTNLIALNEDGPNGYHRTFDSYKRTTFGVLFDNGLNRDWQFQLGQGCTTECNQYYQWPDCASTITFVESQPNVGITDFWERDGSISGGRCNVTDLVFTPYSANNP